MSFYDMSKRISLFQDNKPKKYGHETRIGPMRYHIKKGRLLAPPV